MSTPGAMMKVDADRSGVWPMLRLTELLARTSALPAVSGTNEVGCSPVRIRSSRLLLLKVALVKAVTAYYLAGTASATKKVQVEGARASKLSTFTKDLNSFPTTHSSPYTFTMAAADIASKKRKGVYNHRTLAETTTEHFQARQMLRLRRRSPESRTILLPQRSPPSLPKLRKLPPQPLPRSPRRSQRASRLRTFSPTTRRLLLSPPKPPKPPRERRRLSLYLRPMVRTSRCSTST